MFNSIKNAVVAYLAVVGGARVADAGMCLFSSAYGYEYPMVIGGAVSCDVVRSPCDYKAPYAPAAFVSNSGYQDVLVPQGFNYTSVGFNVTGAEPIVTYNLEAADAVSGCSSVLVAKCGPQENIAQDCDDSGSLPMDQTMGVVGQGWHQGTIDPDRMPLYCQVQALPMADSAGPLNISVYTNNYKPSEGFSGEGMLSLNSGEAATLAFNNSAGGSPNGLILPEVAFVSAAAVPASTKTPQVATVFCTQDVSRMRSKEIALVR